MPDSLGHPPELKAQATETERRADVVFGWIFDGAVVLLSILALLLM